MASTGPESPIRTDEINDFFTYIASIDWTEKWLIALVMFHFTCFFLIIVTRKSGLLQAIIFITLLLSVYFAENLNELAAKHWQVFTKEQYFDSDGLFFSTVYSTPVLFNCLLLLVRVLSPPVLIHTYSMEPFYMGSTFVNFGGVNIAQMYNSVSTTPME
uniref:Transmembrane protein 18 n=1 Tax=Magallana gigas TaxID=29159 RepID=K1R6M5_MAGGI